MQDGNKLYKIIGICLVLSLVITIVTSNIVSITALTLINTGSVVSGGTGTVSTTGASDTTAAGGDTTPADTQANVTVIDTTGSGTAGTTSGGNNTGTTKKSGGTNATVKPTAGPKNNAEAAALYNNAVNKTKAFKGNVKVKRVEGITTVVTEMGMGLKSLAEKALPNSYPETREGTFKNGAATADTRINKDGEKKVFDPGTKLIGYLPPPNSKNASLQAAGIKLFKYTPVGSGYKLEITLVKETGDGINFIPPYHSSVMDTLAISDEDLGDFRVMNATATYAGATIVANVNAQGLLTSLNIKEVVNIAGKVGHKSLGSIGVNAVIDGNWKQDITLTY